MLMVLPPSLELVATTLGRVDAAVRLGGGWVGRFVWLRAVGRLLGVPMIALVAPEGEGVVGAMEIVGRRGRGGVLPTARLLREAMGEARAARPGALDEPSPSPSDERLTAYDTMIADRDRTYGPIVRAALAAGALRDDLRLARLSFAWSLTAAGVLPDFAVVPDLGLDPALAAPAPAAAGDLQHRWLAALCAATDLEGRAVLDRIATARAVIDRDTAKVRETHGRAAHAMLDVLALLQDRGALDVPAGARALDVTPPTVASAIARLETLGIMREITGRERDRVWVEAGLVAAFT